MNINFDQVAITGMSYISNDKCMTIARQMCWPCVGPRDASRILKAKGFLNELPKNWGRFDPLSLTTFAAALWACVDAGIPFDQGKQRIGIIAADPQGTLDSNRAFFMDYVSAGRNSARSNLFVYTLPTTPLAEVAIYCGFTGPTFYLYQPSGGFGRLLEEAAICFTLQGVDAMLAVCADSKEAVCLAVQKNCQKSLFTHSFVKDRLKGVIAVDKILQALDISIKGEDDL